MAVTRVHSNGSLAALGNWVWGGPCGTSEEPTNAPHESTNMGLFASHR